MKKNFFLVFLVSVSFCVCASAQTTDNPDGTMSAANGMSYIVVSTSTITKADPGHCGYNDLGLPNTAIYNVEVRQYSQYDNGTLVKSWTETIEDYAHCYEP